MNEDQQTTVINGSSGKLAKHLLFSAGRNSFLRTFPNAILIGEISAATQLCSSLFEQHPSSALWDWALFVEMLSLRFRSPEHPR